MNTLFERRDHTRSHEILPRKQPFFRYDDRSQQGRLVEAHGWMVQPILHWDGQREIYTEQLLRREAVGRRRA